MDSTLEYYDKNAQTYFDRVHNLDMTELYASFFKHMSGNTILDLGCGTGRDARYFTERKYRVIAVDGSKEMLAMTKRECPAADCRLIDFNEPFLIGEPIDAVWACASLLHLNDENFERTLKAVAEDLRADGVIFLGLKSAEHSKVPSDTRTFNYWTSEKLTLISSRCGLVPLEFSSTITEQATWLDAFLKKPTL